MNPLQLIQHLNRIYKSGIPTYISGSPGIGKSEVVAQFAASIKYKLYDVRTTLIDAVDLRGIPTIHNGITKWCPPIFLPTEENSILFLDELGAAIPSIQAALYQLMIERKLGEYELPKNCYIIAAGNTTADKAVAYKLSSALRNRMSMVTLESNAKEWCVYGLMNEVDSRVIGYISARPESLCGEITATDAFATPRSWFNLSKVIKEETDMDVILSLASSLIGTPTAIDFVAHLKYANTLPTVSEVINDPLGCKIPDEITGKHAIMTNLLYKTKGVNLNLVLKYLSRLGTEFETLFMTLVTKANPKVGSCDAYVKWAMNNAEVLL